jgi:hypothetical protein
MSRDGVPLPTLQDVRIQTQAMAQLASQLQTIRHPPTNPFWLFEDWQKRRYSAILAQFERAQGQNQHAEVLRLDELLTEFIYKFGVDKYASLGGKNKRTQSPKESRNLLVTS